MTRGETIKKGRRLIGLVFKYLCFGAVVLSLFMLVLLLWDILRAGAGWLDWQFLTSFPSRFPASAGIKSAFWGSIWLTLLTALFSIPLGTGAAIYLEEYAPRNRLTRLIEINISNLAGVPSIVYGILGLAIFVRTLSLRQSLLAGALTMTLLILPIIIISSQEAIRAVPNSIREASLAMGATKWQTIRHHVLPVALPGILTGSILSLSRAIGETAPLIIIGAKQFIAFTPTSPLDPFTALPLQIFNWTSRPQPEFRHLAAAAIIVLLVLLLTMNATAIYLRGKYQRKLKW